MLPTISSPAIFLASLLLPQLSYSISTPTRAAPPTFSLAVKYTKGMCPEIPLYLSATGFATPDPSAAAQLYLSPDGRLYEYGVVGNTYGTCSPALSGAFTPLATNCTDAITTTFSGVFYGPLLWTSPHFHTPDNQAAFFLTEGGTVLFDGAAEASGEGIYLVYDCKFLSPQSLKNRKGAANITSHRLFRTRRRAHYRTPISIPSVQNCPGTRNILPRYQIPQRDLSPPPTLPLPHRCRNN
jgi:hypothetical protein